MAETTFTLRNPPYSYLQLRMTYQAPASHSQKPREQHELDEITLLSHTISALSQYLGLTGTAIPVDVLKVEGVDGWIRIPNGDEKPVVAALSQWIGKGGVSLQVLGRGSWLGGLGSGTEDGKLWSLEK